MNIPTMSQLYKDSSLLDDSLEHSIHIIGLQ